MRKPLYRRMSKGLAEEQPGQIVRLSPFGMVTRVLVVGVLAYWVWEKLTQNM